MDVFKPKEDRKKSKTLNKKKGRGTKLNQTVKRKTTERANHKAVSYDKGVHKFNEIRHVCKPILNKRLTAGRLKPKQNQEGIFLKGLRTQYVNRDSLNEANEARKNEDINKIIDLGGVMARKGVAAPKKYKREKADGKKFKLKDLVSFDVQNSNFDNLLDFERCPLSPIRSDKKDANTYGREDCSQSIGIHKLQMKENEINFNEEFKKFAAKYEERVGTDILTNIPGSDILETTLRSLRRLYIKRKQDLKEESDEIQGFKFFNTYDETINQMDLTMSHHKEITENFFTMGELPIPEESSKFYPSLNPLSSNIKLLENDHLQSNEFCSPISFLQIFENDSISGEVKSDPTLEPNLLPKEYKIPKREVNFVSPPIRFFPRSMF